ncbi:sugar-binding transcriptional regulator [Pseudalkalibacillus hwajinpoensis]|uniref:sugar-binding transcriptional regulator n=1 Tax=Guptibacillus hwajinpoensis TaxID=208199 RepID=UPI001CD48347|nr:sugar-binding transcriptional regulator [Pseudalkalibacillus hwajinpoensis]MCA0993450.1 sugar-binding transcriptional regulator [Pseudalkalibacillus hwajinpoensis]
MEEREEIKRLYQVARMYYEQDMTQSEIAKELGIYRTTISRMLKKIREKEIVQIRINYDAFKDVTIGRKLKEQFQLEEVVVIPKKDGATTDQKLKAMGQACATFLDGIVKADDVIGFSWGTALAAVAEELTPQRSREGIMCVPLVGGPDGKLESRYHANTIVYEIARKWKAQSKLIDLPAIVQTEELKTALIDSGHFQEVQELWSRLSIAVVGIGSPLISHGPNWRAFYGETFKQEMDQDNIVGDICSNFFNRRGEIRKTRLSNRTISVNMKELHSTRYTIGIAQSKEKVEAIRAALKYGHLNVLVTTEETAMALVEEAGAFE